MNSYMPDYEQDYDTHCPHCDHTPVHLRDCGELGCDDGYFDEYEDDAINYSPGECLTRCDTCNGTGIEMWCPSCGQDPRKVRKEVKA